MVLVEFLEGGHAGKFSSERLFEWISSLIFLSLGIYAFFHPGLIGESVFHYLLLVIDQIHFSVLAITLAIVHIIALLINGRYNSASCYMRMACTAVSAIIWLEMGAALLKMHVEHPELEIISPPVYLSLALGEFISCFRAAVDSQRQWQKK